jgi:hypothetical protein
MNQKKRIVQLNNIEKVIGEFYERIKLKICTN